MTRKRKVTTVTTEEINAFEQAVQGTKPLVRGKERIAAPKPHVKRRYKDMETVEEEITSYLDGSEPSESIQDTDFIEYNQDGVSHKMLRKLSKGQYTVQAVLDLHRRTVDEARLLVDEFLHTCLKLGIRCVLIIHGKGRPGGSPVLKNYINHWLKNAAPVIAMTTAAPKDGGQGAVYVLLRAS